MHSTPFLYVAYKKSSDMFNNLDQIIGSSATLDAKLQQKMDRKLCVFVLIFQRGSLN